MKVSISRAIQLGEEAFEKWKRLEEQGRASGMSSVRREIIDELKRFRDEFEANQKNTQYVCRSTSGYIDMLQNNLFHTKWIITTDVEEAKKRLEAIEKKLRPLIYLLEGIDIEV